MTRKRLETSQTCAARRPKARRGVTVVQNTVEWRRDEQKWSLGFSSVFAKILYENLSICRSFAPRSCTTRIQLRCYLQSKFEPSFGWNSVRSPWRISWGNFPWASISSTRFTRRMTDILGCCWTRPNGCALRERGERGPGHVDWAAKGAGPHGERQVRPSWASYGELLGFGPKKA
jgi:hypothetical protein